MKDKIDATLSTRKISVLGISEANILKDDPEGSVKMRGFDLITDNLFRTWGSARSAIYISDKFKYSIREDLMDDNTAEVWLEIEKSSNSGQNLLFCQFYREFSLLRGPRSVTGSGTHDAQKQRLLKWIDKVNTVIDEEKKDILVGGDFNADMMDIDSDVFAKL